MRRVCPPSSSFSTLIYPSAPLKDIFRSLSRVNAKKDRSLRVPVGGSGHVHVDILSALKPPKTTSHNIVVYLPSGLDVIDPVPDTTTTGNAVETPQILSALLPTSSIVTVKYRLSTASSGFGYPVPIHDVSSAFHHILSTFNTNKALPRVYLYGTHIGGALACMLALTQPNDINGLVVSQPLVDWVGLEDQTNKEETAAIHRTKKAGPTEAEVEAASSLIRLRTSFFPSPGAFFDPFASPCLFLRAPGRDTPRSYNIEDQDRTPNANDVYTAEAYGPYDDDLSYNNQFTTTEDPHYPLSYISPNATHAPSSSSSFSTPQRRRKVLRRWPPTGASNTITLPPTRIFLPTISPQSSGLDRILHRQGSELAELMRRACFWGRDKGFAEERVGVEMYKPQPGDHLMHQVRSRMEVERGRMGQVAKWMRTMFDEQD